MRYQWQSDASLIQEVTFTGNGGKAIREAVIAVPAHAKASEKLRNLDKLFIDNGMAVSYDIQDSQPVMRVSGFRHAKQLLILLKKEEIVSGNSTFVKSNKKPPSMWRGIRDNSLVLSAVFYMLGNAATAVSGWFRNDMDELRSGLAFSVGDSFMLLFGKTSDKEKHQHVMHGFGEFLRKHGYTPDVGSNFAASAMKGANAYNSLKKTMKSLVIPIKSVSEIYAGYSFAKAGFNQENGYKKIAGSALMTGFGLGLLIPEKSESQIRDILGVDTPEQAKKKYKTLSGTQRAKYAIMRQPLIISGGFAAINNLSTIFGAFDEKNHSRNVRKIEAELGIDSKGNKLATKSSSYEMAILNYTKTKKVEKTAHAAYDELKAKIDDSQISESERAETMPKLLEAKAKVETLKKEYETSTKGKLGVDGSKFWIFNLLQGGFFLIANSLYAMSSKSGSGSQELTDRFISAVSTEIVKNPDPISRVDLITLAAQYGSKLEEMDFTTAEMRKMIEERVEQLQDSPWVQKYNRSESEKLVAKIDPNELTPEKQQKVKEILEAPEKPKASFADKVAQQAAEAEQAAAIAAPRA